MRRLTALSLVLLMALTAVFPAGTVSAGWIENRAWYYPEERWITAVGSGRNVEAATKNAMEQLAAAFGTSVVSQTVTHEVEESGADGTWTDQFFRSDVGVTVNVSDIVGMRIQETVKKGDTWFALAVIERGPCADHYEPIVKAEWAAVQKEYERLSSLPSSFETYRDACELSRVWAKLLSDHGILSVVAPDRAKLYELPDRNWVYDLRDAIQYDLEISISVRNDLDGAIDGALYEAFTDYGIYVTDDRGAQYRVEGNLQMRYSENGRFTYATWSLSLSLRDTKGRKTIMTWTNDGRQGGRDRTQAMEMAINKISEAIRDDFMRAFEKTF